jgi:fructosamine-3-kinase
MFVGEKAGLEAILSTGTVKCPKPLTIVSDGPSHALVMETLTMKSMNTSHQAILGEQLAK